MEIPTSSSSSTDRDNTPSKECGCNRSNCINCVKKEDINNDIPKYNKGCVMDPEAIEDKDDDNEFWDQFRGDYLDLRDFVKQDTEVEKVAFILKLSKKRVTLLREHLLLLWTFKEDARDELTNELLILNRIIYNDDISKFKN
jgi:hypothetical protein